MIDRKLLEKYYKSSQSVAEAIKEVLGLDVSMLNENIYRVSGTGIYFDEIGKKVSEDSIFGSCLRLNKALVVIDDRGEKRIYESCSNRVECGELAVYILGTKYTLMMSINYLNIVDDCKEKTCPI